MFGDAAGDGEPDRRGALVGLLWLCTLASTILLDIHYANPWGDHSLDYRCSEIDVAPLLEP